MTGKTKTPRKGGVIGKKASGTTVTARRKLSPFAAGAGLVVDSGA